ncbi:hypothetical protein FIBSPDRAFT_834849 [Athelia psychrophila]|uniref:F-box domain-containing protein n=1 Tax=Athelia psychrophila TaxID=1759441 RepID=A0A166CKD2_9AGAM|nr:hypothetical protein FIBSPDRAFT_834849 [Fibularhizoctonia sp. CBS 109695]
MPLFRPETVPTDILPYIFEALTDRRDLHAAALTSHAFNTAATPLLYRSLDGIVVEGRLYHPAPTLLARPDLALYVRDITETAAVHRIAPRDHPNITETTLAALRLCKKLRRISWNDDSYTIDIFLRKFFAAIRELPIRDLVVRSYSDFGEETWSHLTQMRGLEKVAIWCMEGPPRVLQGWADKLGSTLTHLELGRCAGVPPTILISVISQVPLLRDLRLRGAPSNCIPTLLAYLPNLETLHTEFISSGINRPASMPPPRLKSLTVRTSSMDSAGLQKLWYWITLLTPHKSLESFTLDAHSVQGQTSVPANFISGMAETQGSTLKRFMVDTTRLTLADVWALCTKFPQLEHLACAVASPHVDAIRDAIAPGRNLCALTLNVSWIPEMNPVANWDSRTDAEKLWDSKSKGVLTMQDATEIMLAEGSRIRMIGMGPDVFTVRKLFIQGGGNVRLTLSGADRGVG